MWAKQRELYDSDDEVDQSGVGAYHSIAKPAIINEQSEGGTSHPCNRTMSNFSA